MMHLVESLSEKRVVVCCGPGGVGKTTVSSALALSLAESGKRVCVLTIDPARRLTDALGIEELDNTPRLIPDVRQGSLRAAMLTTEATFDALIDRYAPSPEQAATIKANRLYQNLATSLSGMQEYMAIEKLNELMDDETIDIVVLDTPPTRNALDVITAPTRLTRFLENRVFRALLSPTSAYLRAISVATQSILKTLGAAAGAELVDDAVGFFQAFTGMERGFSERASTMRDLLASHDTAYVLVTSPRSDAIEEARFFAGQLLSAELSTHAVIVNRVLGGFSGPEIPASLLDRDDDVGQLGLCAQDLRRAAEDARGAIQDVALAMAPTPVITLGFQQGDLHSLEGLRELGVRLVTSDVAPGP